MCSRLGKDISLSHCFSLTRSVKTMVVTGKLWERWGLCRDEVAFVRDFIKGWAPAKLTGYGDGFAHLGWPSPLTIFEALYTTLTQGCRWGEGFLINKFSSKRFCWPEKTSCPSAENVNETLHCREAIVPVTMQQAPEVWATLSKVRLLVSGKILMQLCIYFRQPALTSIELPFSSHRSACLSACHS